MSLVHQRTSALVPPMCKMIVLLDLPVDPDMDSQLRDGSNGLASRLFELALQVNLWLSYVFLRQVDL